jgi:hypothetical protein
MCGMDSWNNATVRSDVRTAAGKRRMVSPHNSLLDVKKPPATTAGGRVLILDLRTLDPRRDAGRSAEVGQGFGARRIGSIASAVVDVSPGPLTPSAAAPPARRG